MHEFLFNHFKRDHNHFNDFRIPERQDESPISSLQVIALETHFRTSTGSAILPKFENIKKEISRKLASLPGAIGFAFPPPAIPGVGTAGGATFILEDRAGKDLD